MNFIELIQRQAAQVFGNQDKADVWLNQRKSVFGGVTPIEFAHTEIGYNAVKDVLERIDKGYPS